MEPWLRPKAAAVPVGRGCQQVRVVFLLYCTFASCSAAGLE